MVSTEQTESPTRESSPGEYRVYPALVEDRDWSAYSEDGPLKFIFGRRERVPIVQSRLYAVSESQNEGRAAGEKKHDEA